MTRKNLTFKGAFTAADDGAFTGEASTFGNVDSYGDRVMPAAFSKDLRRRGAKRPLLWNHLPTEPIGFVELAETARGLRVTKGTLVLDVPRAREIYALMKAGVIDAMSIGYETVTSRAARDGARELTEITLWEVSLVTFPANALALVDSVKRGPAGLDHRMRETLAAMKVLKLQMRIDSLDRRLKGR